MKILIWCIVVVLFTYNTYGVNNSEKSRLCGTTVDNSVEFSLIWGEGGRWMQVATDQYIWRSKGEAVDVLWLRDDGNVNEQLIPFEHLNKVLLCLDSDNQLTKLTKGSIGNIDLRWKLNDEHPDLTIEHSSVSSCPHRIEEEGIPQDRKGILAVVAPKPLKLSYQIPTYFFETPFHYDQDADEFPNGLFPLRDHWQSLKYAFSHYIAVHGWSRLVIISDDSYYSQAFEEELIGHFREKEFVFEVLRSVDTKDGCNFDRALKYIKDNEAFIIIVNIDKAHAQNLANAARCHDMLSDRFVWLVREWPFENVKKPIMKRMISMTLSPYHAPHYDTERDHDGPNLNSVSRGLALISDAVKNVREKERLDYYYKAIYKQMYKTNKCNLSKAFIRNFFSGNFFSIKSIIIHDSGHIDSPYPKDKYGDDFDLAEYCLQRSMSFKSPCNDNYIVFICVVWIMFVLMLILLVFFFNRCLVWT